jgi:rhamnosyltransferase
MILVPAGIVIYQPDINVLGRLIKSLELGGRRFFIFVNGLLDPQLSDLLGRLSSARLIYSEVNVGQGAGLNAITEAAVSESFSHLILFDQDSEPFADLPEQLLVRWTSETARGARLAVVGPLLVPPPDAHYRQIQYAWRSVPGNGPLTPVHFVPTSGSLICLAAFVTIGRFREDFFIGGIDVEWGFRAWSHGYGSVVARDLTMIHRWGEAASPEAAQIPQIVRHSHLRKYYYIRNLVYSLSLTSIPLFWRLRYALGLCGQIGYLMVFGGHFRKLSAVIFAGMRDGMFGQLGPVRPDLSMDLLQ